MCGKDETSHQGLVAEVEQLEELKLKDLNFDRRRPIGAYFLRNLFITKYLFYKGRVRYVITMVCAILMDRKGLKVKWISRWVIMVADLKII